MLAAFHLQLAGIEIDIDQRRGTDGERHRDEIRRAEAIVRNKADRRGARETRFRRELQVHAIARHRRAAVACAGDTETHGVVFRIGKYRPHRRIRCQSHVCVEGRRQSRWRLVGLVTQIGIEQLRITEIQLAVEVEVRREQVGVAGARIRQQLRIHTINLLIAIHIARDKQPHRVVAVTEAADREHVEPGTVDTEQRKRAIPQSRTGNRSEASELRNGG